MRTAMVQMTWDQLKTETPFSEQNMQSMIKNLQKKVLLLVGHGSDNQNDMAMQKFNSTTNVRIANLQQSPNDKMQARKIKTEIVTESKGVDLWRI